METLTVNNAKSLEGKIIKWEAPGYYANGKYMGVAKIIAIDLSKRQPIESETISGDNLKYAFINRDDEGTLLSKGLCFSDADRYVEFEIIEK